MKKYKKNPKWCFGLLCMMLICLVGCGKEAPEDTIKKADYIQEDMAEETQEVVVQENISVGVPIRESVQEPAGVKESHSLKHSENISVSHSESVSVSQISESKPIPVVIQEGKTITLKKGEFVHPDNFDFGENQKFAVEIYEYIIKGCQSFDLKTKFASKNEAEQFLKNFDRCIPQEIKIKITESTNEITQPDGTKSDILVYRFEYKIFTRQEQLSAAINKSYDACIKAGIQTGMTEKEAVEKISSWIMQNMTYEINNGEAYVGFTTGRGQCMTYALMFEEMCKSCGIECEYIVGMDGTHAWNKVKIGNEWFWSDLTWADSEDGSAYLLSDALWSTHWL